MRLVRREAEHDEVRVKAVKAVGGVGVKSRLRALLSHELHDLVLALPRDARVGQDHLKVPPTRIAGLPLDHMIREMAREPVHELSAENA